MKPVTSARQRAVPAAARPAVPASQRHPAGDGCAAGMAARLGNRGMQALLGLAPQRASDRAQTDAPRDDPRAEQAADEAARRALQWRAGVGNPRTGAGAPRAPAVAATSARGDVPGHVQAVVSSPGEVLPSGVSGAMGEAFGADFSRVAIHRDRQAARSASQLGASAYAVGSHVVFGEGRFAPESPGGRELIAHELAHVLQQRDGVPRVQRRKNSSSAVTYVEVAAEGFDEAAASFAAMMASHTTFTTARIVIVNGPNVKVYDESGKPVVKKFFHLNTAASLPVGVFGRAGGRALHAVSVQQDGKWAVAGEVVSKGTVDFASDIDDQEGFDKAIRDGGVVFYVAPRSTAVPAVADAPVPEPMPIENLPEFMQFEAKTKANLPAWPSATLPVSSQLATVNSTGTFVCRVDKNQGVNMIDRVTNLMQTTSFRWEVLKLDEKLHVTGSERTTGLDSAAEGFARRRRQLQDDREAMRGDRRRQSIPETVFRAAIDQQTAGARASLAMVGQTVMTAINAITGGPNQLTTEDAMDVPFKEQGDYFVRCLATQHVPSDAKFRRATSVSGVMVSVYDIQEVARDALVGGTELTQDAFRNKAQAETGLAALDAKIAAGEGNADFIRVEREYAALEVAYYDELARAGADPLAAKVARQSLLRARLHLIDTSPVLAGAQYSEKRAAARDGVKTALASIDAELSRMRGALAEHGSQIEPVGFMRAMLVDEVTSAKTALSFAVGERKYIAAGNLEVVIADVTGAKGRTFNGVASGALGAGRQDAWLDAMTDLRRNLNRGRGWISYEVPARYEAWKSELPNPMKLEMSMGAQLKETVDDAAHALTIAAILAAPFTGGASLSILAVLAPVQAASSLYNLVNRAAYGDLQLDQEAVFDLLNIVTLGLGKVSTVGKVGSRGLEIIASSSKMAIKLINGGQFLVISYETYNTLMEEGDPKGDPRELRRKKLLKLLSWCEQAAIPISEKLFAEAHGSTPRPDKTAAGRDATVVFEEPMAVAGGRRKPTVQEGPILEPAARAPERSPVEPTAEVAPRPASEGVPVGAEAAVAHQPTKAQVRGLPERLQGKVAVVEGMGKNARIVYKRGEGGLITDVQIQIGEGASAADVHTHAVVAELMLKYSGTGGRVRQLLGRFVELFAGPSAERPAIGSRAWEAKFELTKLDRMMGERHAELAAIADQPAAERDVARQKELASDLDALELQYREHAQVYNAIEMGSAQGRGYVAAEGLNAAERIAGREAERFEPGTDRAQAFRELGGYQPGSRFGAFVDLLLAQGLIKTRQEMIDALGEPSSRSHETVRTTVMALFQERLVMQVTSATYLKKQPKYRQVLAAGGSAKEAKLAAVSEELRRIGETVGGAELSGVAERAYDTLSGNKPAPAGQAVKGALLDNLGGLTDAGVAYLRQNVASVAEFGSKRRGGRRIRLDTMTDAQIRERFPTESSWLEQTVIGEVRQSWSGRWAPTDFLLDNPSQSMRYVAQRLAAAIDAGSTGHTLDQTVLGRNAFEFIRNSTDPALRQAWNALEASTNPALRREWNEFLFGRSVMPGRNAAEQAIFRQSLLTTAGGGFEGFGSGLVGDKRPDIIEVVLSQDALHVIDPSQRWSNPVHNFKSAFYESVLRELVNVGQVTSADTGGGARIRPTGQ